MFRFLLSYMTFPGIIAHEFAHAWACRRLGIRVEQVCYLRIGNPLGYVRHERPTSPFQQAMVTVAPFFLSTLLAMTLSFCACLLAKSRLPPETRDMATLLTAWCSFSIALHAFPSSGDADALRDEIGSPDVGFTARIMLIPLVAIIRLARLGTRLWLDILFALAIVALPPALLLVLTGE